MIVRGGCLCGVVQFEADLPFATVVRCYCSRCRSATGSAFATNAYVLPSAFRWLSGEAEVARFDLPSARSFSTSFCRHCGAPLPHATRSGREIIIPMGSLREVPADIQIVDAHWDSRVALLAHAVSSEGTEP
jgi:hypothetical protein